MSDLAPRKIISVDFYKQENGKEPVREWLKSLKKGGKARDRRGYQNGARRMAFGYAPC